MSIARSSKAFIIRHHAQYFSDDIVRVWMFLRRGMLGHFFTMTTEKQCYTYVCIARVPAGLSHHDRLPPRLWKGVHSLRKHHRLKNRLLKEDWHGAIMKTLEVLPQDVPH